MYTRRKALKLITTGSLLGAAGCSGDDSPPLPTETPQNPSPGEDTTTPRSPGQTVTYNDVQAVVSEPFISTEPLRWGESDDKTTESPLAGGAFLLYRVSIKMWERTNDGFRNLTT